LNTSSPFCTSRARRIDGLVKDVRSCSTWCAPATPIVSVVGATSSAPIALSPHGLARTRSARTAIDTPTNLRRSCQAIALRRLGALPPPQGPTLPVSSPAPHTDDLRIRQRVPEALPDTLAAVAAGAQIVAAGGTIVLALKTSRLATKTADLATDTRDEATATVALSREAKRDRELRYRPVILATANVQNPISENAAGIVLYSVSLRNVGQGPALRCALALIGERGTYLEYGLGALAAGEDTGSRPSLDARPILPPVSSIFDPPSGMSQPPKAKTLVVTYEDLVGNRWRFLDGLRAESWSPDSEEPMPEWASWVPAPHAT
jgi:hypothetical protein